MLPIRRVVLYKHGVGYFEREGEVEGDASVDLYFKAAEMNDVLKSLTTLDRTGGVISSISYESTKPVEKQLEDIAVRIPDQNSLRGLLAQVKGAHVAVEVGPKKVEGAIAGIEIVTRREKDATIESPRLVLLVGGQSLQSFDLLEVKSVSFLDENLRKDLGHLLDILISAKKKDLKKLTIFGKGKGRRKILASYTVETPVWKTSYRLLLGDKQPTIQGWALVDNTQEEDWESVSLSLVAGLPISFVHDLYSPRYKRRPIVEVVEEEAYAPPMLEAGAEVFAASEKAETRAYPMGAPAPCPPAAASPMAGKRSVQVQTRTVEVGDLFQYEIKNPVTVRRNQSALVPILQTTFEGRRVAVYNPEIREKNPMSAVLFKNTTGMTLEGGPVTVLEGEHYVGESMLETLKPGEERLVPFSVELGCAITVDDKSDLQEVRQARIQGGTLYLYRYRIQRRIYLLNNKTDKALDLFLEHRFQTGWDLIETEKPVEKTDHFLRFRLAVAPKKSSKFVVTEKGDEYTSYSIQNVDRDQVRIWLESRFIDRKTSEVLHGVIELSEKIALLRREIQEREQEIQALFQNQERLRENLQALGASQDEKGLRERYVAELAGEEDKLREHRTEIRGKRSELEKVEREWQKKISGVKFEAKL